MGEVYVRTDYQQVDRWFDAAVRRQLPFAGALALTRVAQIAQLVERASLGRKFTLRSDWVRRGILVVHARKQDWPNAWSAVGSRDEFMVLQETGGTKRPTRSARLAVPGMVSGVRGAGGRVPRRRRPKALLAKPRYFAQRLARGQRAGASAVLQRVGRERYPLRVMYLLEPEAHVRAVLELREDVARVAQRHYGTEWTAALEGALSAVRPAVRT